MLRDTRLARPFERHRLQRAAHSTPIIAGRSCPAPGCAATASPATSSAARPSRATRPCPTGSATASLDPARIAGWWQRTNYGVLLATGHSFDVLEVAGPIGWRLAREARGPGRGGAPRTVDVPRARRRARSCRRWPSTPSVVLHRAGSWIPAPPTPLPTGTVRWLTRPAACDWEPADPVAGAAGRGPAAAR